MPYYVYAIYTDFTSNRLYGKFEEFKEASRVEEDMRAGNCPGDNYFVRMIFAETDDQAKEKANSLRPARK